MNTALIALIAVIALAGAGIVVSRFLRLGQRLQPEVRGAPDFPPTPKWRPSVAVDIPRIVETFAIYTNHKKSFAVFEHGTCVVLPEDTISAEQAAKAILDAVYRSHPDFDPQRMKDGNFFIFYSQPAGSIVFKDEFAEHREYIERHYMDGIVREEVLLSADGKPYTFEDLGKIGLFGRARMFLDAQNPRIVHVWRPLP